MPFEKAKRTLDKTTPGVEDINRALVLYGELARLTEKSAAEIVDIELSEKAQYNHASSKLDEAYSRLVQLKNIGAITNDTFEVFSELFSHIQSEITDKVPRRAVYNSIESLATKETSELANNISRYARAPNAVGLGRTVTE